MKSILIAAKTKHACDNLSQLLLELNCDIVTVSDSYKLRCMDVSAYDIILVSTPLSDEFGLDLVTEIRGKTTAGIIVLAKMDIAQEVQDKINFTGAYVLARPFTKSALLQAVHFASVAQDTIRRLEEQKQELNQQISDLKVIARAKGLLMEYLKLTEEQAHRHIQKQAMDLRITQRAVAEDILNTYLTSR
jgi:response regulator NasT